MDFFASGFWRAFVMCGYNRLYPSFRIRSLEDPSCLSQGQSSNDLSCSVAASVCLAFHATVICAIDVLINKDFLISSLAAAPALQKLSENFSGLHVYAGTIDHTVNEKGMP